MGSEGSSAGDGAGGGGSSGVWKSRNLGSWESGNLKLWKSGIPKHQATKNYIRIKIHPAQNVRRGLIGRNKTAWTHVGAVFDSFPWAGNMCFVCEFSLMDQLAALAANPPWKGCMYFYAIVWFNLTPNPTS